MKAATTEPAKRGRPPKVRYRVEGIPEDAMRQAIEEAVAKRTAEIERKAEKRIKEASKRVSEASAARRVWYGPDKLRAAFFAGQGRTPDQIAQTIGGTTGPRVRTLLHQRGIGFNRDGGFADQIMLNWKKADRELIEKPAAKRERDAFPKWLLIGGIALMTAFVLGVAILG